jgi:O-antigen/teichoic acid export membrane protein
VKYIAKLLNDQNLFDHFNRLKPLLFNYFTLFVTGVVSLFLTSRMSFLFTPSDINYYEQTISIATIFVTISIWGYDASAIFDEAKRHTKNYLSISLMLLLNFSILTIGAILLNSYFHWFRYLNLILLITVTNLTFSTLSNMMTYSGFIKWVNCANIISALVRVSTIMLFIFLFEKNMELWLYALVFTNFSAICFIGWMCRDVFFNGIYRRQLFFLKYVKYTHIGLLLILPQLLSIFSERFGRIFVSYQHESVGGAGYQLAQSTSLILLSLNVGYSRYFASDFFAKTKQMEIIAYINSHLKSYLLICVLGIIACIFFWKFFIDETYSSSGINTMILVMLCISYIIDGLVKFYLFSLNYLKKYKLITIYMIVFFTIYVLLTFILNKPLATLGIVISSLTSNVVLLILLYITTINESK